MLQVPKFYFYVSSELYIHYPRYGSLFQYFNSSDNDISTFAALENWKTSVGFLKKWKIFPPIDGRRMHYFLLKIWVCTYEKNFYTHIIEYAQCAASCADQLSYFLLIREKHTYVVHVLHTTAQKKQLWTGNELVIWWTK